MDFEGKGFIKVQETTMNLNFDKLGMNNPYKR
jgi:hypothetical protein